MARWWAGLVVGGARGRWGVWLAGSWGSRSGGRGGLSNCSTFSIMIMGGCCHLLACCKLMQYTVAILTITEPDNNTTI